jgi:hypothetical protein
MSFFLLSLILALTQLYKTANTKVEGGFSDYLIESGWKQAKAKRLFLTEGGPIVSSLKPMID